MPTDVEPTLVTVPTLNVASIAGEISALTPGTSAIAPSSNRKLTTKHAVYVSRALFMTPPFTLRFVSCMFVGVGMGSFYVATSSGLAAYDTTLLSVHMRYERGNGVAQNYLEAAHWYRLAAMSLVVALVCGGITSRFGGFWFYPGAIFSFIAFRECCLYAKRWSTASKHKKLPAVQGSS